MFSISDTAGVLFYTALWVGYWWDIISKLGHRGFARCFWWLAVSIPGGLAICVFSDAMRIFSNPDPLSFHQDVYESVIFSLLAWFVLAGISAFLILILLVVPWPIDQKMLESNQKLEISSKQLEFAENEVKELKQQVERKTKYITAVNQEVERLKSLAVESTVFSGDSEIDLLQAKLNQLRERRRREKL